MAKCAVALEALGLKPGDRMALNMPSIVPQIYWTEAAKRMGVVYTAVFGGFSDKTLDTLKHLDSDQAAFLRQIEAIEL